MRYDNLTPTFGAIIHDIDLTSLTHEKSRFLYDLFSKKKILIIPNQKLDNKQLSSVASIFGNVWNNSKEKYNGLMQTNQYGQEDGLIEVVEENGLLGNLQLPWHVDLLHFPSQVLPNRLLYATELQGKGAIDRFH